MTGRFTLSTALVAAVVTWRSVAVPAFAQTDSAPVLTPGALAVMAEAPGDAYLAALRTSLAAGDPALEAIVTPSGCVNNVTVVSGTTAGLDLLALQALSQARFAPARVSGRPVAARIVFSQTFASR
jgi:hypothetical protein